MVSFHQLNSIRNSFFYHCNSSHSILYKLSNKIGNLTTAVILVVTILIIPNNPVHATLAVNTDNSSMHIEPENIQSERNSNNDWAKGRILVMPRAGLPAKAFANILKEHRGKAKRVGQSELYIVDLPEYTEEGVIARLKHHPHIKFAELDQIVQPSFTPNDPYYPNGWHLTKIGAPTAWNNSQGSNLTIAILDSGVDSSHPDLSSRIVPGWNFYDNNSNTTDVYGHGTKVAGVAAATSNNAIGVAGIAGQAKIMPIRVTNTSGTGYYSMMASGLTYAADRGIRIANMSFLGVTNSSSILSAAQYMKNKNGLVTAGTGNTGALGNYTATTSIISVGATDANDSRASWSSYGNYIDIAAPGAGIWTTTRGGGYGSVSGTSYSGPLTAGVIALMMGANPNMKNTDIEKLLFSTTKDLGTSGWDSHYGFGRVDAAAAVLAAKNAAVSLAAEIDTEAPTVSIIEPLSGATLSGIVPVDIQASDNTGVTRAELWVNNTSVAVDTSAPFAFSWDSTGALNGEANLVVRAYDAAGNAASSNMISVTVNNPTQPLIVDTEAPVVSIINPVTGNVSGTVTITANASDNNGASGITLSIYVDNALKATGTGSTLSTSWNTRSKSVTAGMHTVKVVAKDAAGNSSAKSVSVNVIK